VVGVDSGGLKSEKQDEMEFQHQYFIRGCENLLENIKRKISSRTTQFMPSIKTEKVNEVLAEVNQVNKSHEPLRSINSSVHKILVN